MPSRKYVAMMAACAAGGMVMTDAANATVMIDDFETGPGMVDVDNPGPTNFVAAGAIGGSRTLQVLPGASGTELEVQSGVLGHSQSALGTGGSSKTTWDANGLGLGGVDLTDGGVDDAIMFEILSIDVGDVDVTFMVQDTAGGSASVTSVGLVAGSETVPYTDFVGAVDFTDIDVIMLQIDAVGTSDLLLDLLATADTITPPPPPTTGVPEPVSATLGLMGLGALAHATRRR